MILLTNDDGIDAPGLAALEQAVAPEPTVVIAPLHPMSECSHRVTTKEPIRIDRRGDRRFAVDGTPADCVRVGLLHLLPRLGLRSDALRVLSGINAGGNLGADVYISGTVAAVREAAFFGVPGMALSQYRRGQPGEREWARAARWAGRAWFRLRDEPLAAGEFWNVNFPWPLQDEFPEPDLVICDRSRRPLPVKYDHLDGALQYVAGLYHTREHEPDSDIAVCFSGRIAATRITI
jgi:5'-nucleotidase